MEKQKTYYKYLDILRIFSFVAVLLYHLKILKGGYLAVCSFFALSGFLSCTSAFKKEKFSIKEYYLKRLIKIYLPLVAVVFITIPIVSLFKEIVMLNLKPEVMSILLGYNNFWQLSVNLDYFAHHIDSPFMHLWYVSILLQFELIFPIIFIPLRKIGDKCNKIIPCIITALAAIGCTVYFYIANLNQNMMTTYYNTFTRAFSLLFGLSLGFIHAYYKPLILKICNNKVFSRIASYTYLAILAVLVYLIDANSVYYQISMIAVTLITCRLIDYGTTIINDEMSTSDKVIKSISGISYEIYLIQYPIIFIFQYININEGIKLPLMILIMIVLSYILNFAVKTNGKLKIPKYILRALLIGLTIFGIYKYCIAEDHTVEMKQLESELAQNEQIMQKKQEEYEQKYKQEQEKLAELLSDIDKDESKLEEVVTNLPVVGVGDSVLLSITPQLYKKFPNGYFDAQTSRTAWVLNDILNDLKNKNMLGNPVLINLGANGDCSDDVKKKIIQTCGDRDIFWVNVTNDKKVHVNDKLWALEKKYDNFHVIDWNSISKGHPEYFIADGVHLTSQGMKVYIDMIYNAIYEEYSKEYTQKREELLNKHEEEQKNKITLYGNEILLRSYDDLKEKFEEDKFVAKKDFNYKMLKDEIKTSVENESLTNKIVLAFDSKVKITKEQYQELLEMCENKQVYILSMTKESDEILNSLDNENVVILNLYKSIETHENYLLEDKVHLSDEGNKALCELLSRIKL